MKLFNCPACAQLVYFENTKCENCHRTLGYAPRENAMIALEPEGDIWRAANPARASYRFCANAKHNVCNWLVDDGQDEIFCIACRHNRTIPQLEEGENLPQWRKIEAAKHKLFYTLLRLHLPLLTRQQNDEGLVFDFLADEQDNPKGPKVLTGHEDGLITLALIEADDVERERRRLHMGEPYRALLGHFRHEVGHYFWDRLVRDAGKKEAFREVFGDPDLDYEKALQAHYKNGPPADWPQRFVSSYATSHPWEDFAETWAHYLHIVDTLEMADALALQVSPRADVSDSLTVAAILDPYAPVPFERIVTHWLPVSFATNSLNRCMGHADLYPFVLAPPTIGKLDFVHRLVHQQV